MSVRIIDDADGYPPGPTVDEAIEQTNAHRTRTVSPVSEVRGSWPAGRSLPGPLPDPEHHELATLIAETIRDRLPASMVPRGGGVLAYLINAFAVGTAIGILAARSYQQPPPPG